MFEIHPETDETDIKAISKVLGVELEPATINGGIPYLSSGILVNNNAMVVGSLTSGPEIMMLTRAFANQDKYSELPSRSFLIDIIFSVLVISLDFKFYTFEKVLIMSFRKFSNLNDHCGNSDPSLATEEKGQRYLDFICQRISDFLIELAEAEINDHFPHVPEIKH